MWPSNLVSVAGNGRGDPGRLQKVEVAALVGLSDRGQEELAITPLVGIDLARRQHGETRCNFLVADGKFDRPFRHAQAHPVASLHDSNRTANSVFRGYMQ